jgi:protein-S-isoprenylcysteine O-methyltransferase Ste14
VGDLKSIRLFYGIQSGVAVLWWCSVFASEQVRYWTLGSLPSQTACVFDLLLFILPGFIIAAQKPGAKWWGTLILSWSAITVGWTLLSAIQNQGGGYGFVLMGLSCVAQLLALHFLWFGRHLITRTLVGPLGFRVSPETSFSGHLWRTCRQIVCFWGFFLFVLPQIVLQVENLLDLHWIWMESSVVFGLGVSLFLVGSIGGLSSAWWMCKFGDGTPLPSATASKLVIEGPYRCIRNPMAASGILQGIAVGLIMGSWLVVLYAVVGSSLWNTFVRPVEEADLRARFGESFDDYCQKVRCWLPRFNRD